MFWVPAPPSGGKKTTLRSVRRTKPALKQSSDDKTFFSTARNATSGAIIRKKCTEIVHKLLGAAQREDLQEVHKCCYELYKCEIDVSTQPTAVFADGMSRKVKYADIQVSGSRQYWAKMGRYYFAGRSNVQDTLRPYYRHDEGVYLYYLSRHGSWRESGMWCIGKNVGKAEGVLLCNADDVATPDRITQPWKVRAESGTGFSYESGIEATAGPMRDQASQRMDRPTPNSFEHGESVSKGCLVGFAWMKQVKMQKCMKCGKEKTRGYQCAGGNGSGGCHQLCSACHGAGGQQAVQEVASALDPRVWDDVDLARYVKRMVQEVYRTKQQPMPETIELAHR
jgi:hypothetical protein